MVVKEELHSCFLIMTIVSLSGEWIINGLRLQVINNHIAEKDQSSFTDGMKVASFINMGLTTIEAVNYISLMFVEESSTVTFELIEGVVIIIIVRSQNQKVCF